MSAVKELNATKVYGTTGISVGEGGPAPRPCKLKSVSFVVSSSVCVCVGGVICVCRRAYPKQLTPICVSSTSLYRLLQNYCVYFNFVRSIVCNFVCISYLFLNGIYGFTVP
jgi:hypothetical protein